ncbi:MAG: COX15/CtaA family protein [Candidatus Eisenbacteria bacterium]|uniref:COX15/CtaA family protein n=1 Tax=Eiseniibacteriota bacterium TaxID=2212470 RepID=A0A933WB45_UNCEI|nr:COX15/CtaA family protein [Candidatus Eisenbacteria bacterium]
MPSPRAHRMVARTATLTAILMFLLIVVGSIVRTTGSGLSCPDWPLCHGQLIPPMQFNILMEWGHRLLALLVGLLLAATVALVVANRDARARYGGLAALSVALYFSQALLGALTVWKLLDPSVVSGHLAVGLLLFATFVTLATLAHGEGREPGEGARPAGLLPLFALATLLVWFQAVLGGMVSTNHASLACPDWPTCNGEWFPRLEGLVGLQVLHRYGAYALTIVLLTVAVSAERVGDLQVRWLGRLAGRLVLLQIAIGVGNVLLGVPVWVSALHLGNAAAILAVMLVATLRLAALPVAHQTPAGAVAR